MVFVISLGVFQLLMSFLGSTGSAMEDLGLKSGIEITYAPVTSTEHFTRVSDLRVNCIKYYAGRFYHCKLSN